MKQHFSFFASRLLLTCLPLISLSTLSAQVLSVSAARSQAEGSLVTVRGIVTNGPELGRIRYLQDPTGGIGAFPGTGSAPGFEASVKTGDSVEITGKLVNFNNLLEISPVTAYEIISSGNALPQAVQLSLGDIAESMEGKLITIPCASFEAQNSTFQKATTYSITDGTGQSGKIYLRTGHPLLNTTVPAGTVRITGVLGQYNDTYQIQPRSAADLTTAPCLFFEGPPSPVLIQTTGFQWKWRTNTSAQCRLLYGTTPALGQVAIPNGSGPDFLHTISGLQPGTIYWMQVEAEREGQKILSQKYSFATRSGSSGQVKVYFNHSVQESSLGSLKPDGQTFEELLAEILARINAAQKTIDVAMYNINRNDIAAALKAAQQRGVRVRYVGSAQSENLALQGLNTFGILLGNARELMHNKFMVIDAALVSGCWVMGGSTNWTTGSLVKDYNNVVFVQDQSLARAYTLEFEEMYGSSSADPDPARATFGAAKSDNTPHHFLIGGKNTECYFAPTDRVTDHIAQVIGEAQSDAQFALFFFTAAQPAQKLVQACASGAKVRGIIDDIGTGSEYNYLKNNGVQVLHHADPDLFHHKYVVADANQPQSDPTLLTGSFNWTLTAETQNDENILIFHDADLATLFSAEFEARWKESSISSTITPMTQEVRLVPNPAANEVLVTGPISGQITLMDMNGKEWAFELVHNSGTTRLRLEQVPSGQYFIHVKRRDAPTVTLPFQKI